MALDATPHDSRKPFCPKCNVQFQPRRKDQRFCDRACQRAATRNSARGSQKASDSQSSARQLEVNRHRGFLLYDLYRKARPEARPALLEQIVTAARDHDWFLRRKLSDPKLLAVAETYGISEWNRWAYLVQACDQHCRLRWGPEARVYIVVRIGWVAPPEIRPLAYVRATRKDPEEPLPEYRLAETAGFFQWLRDEVQPRRRPMPNRPLAIV